MKGFLSWNVLSGILNTMIGLATPFLFAALGETFTQTSGVVNLGVDGIMLLSAFAAFFVSLSTGSLWLGLLAAVLVGLAMGLLMSLVSVTLKAEQGVSGIGARLQTKDGALSIAAIIPGGPAAKDGRLQVGDVVSAVAQGDGPWAQTEGMSGSQVVALVRGDSGSIVRLKVLRGGSQTLTVSLVRASVQVVAAPADAGAPAEASAPAASSAPAPRPKPRDTTDYTDQLGP